jgi:4-amino-4-deoxy-L-arabinose transferase-like glycosyltransferase
LRTTIAYEMFKSSNYAQPYLLGEPYYNKPGQPNCIKLYKTVQNCKKV